MTKLPMVLSCILLTSLPFHKANNEIHVNNQFQDQTLDCQKCYFQGTSYSPNTGNGVNQTCVLSPDKKVALWVNNGANVMQAPCDYCYLLGLVYREGARNGTTNPPQYCKNGKWQ